MLIHAKLHRPRVRSQLVERPRLTARIDDSLDRRVTLVSAPPGFGKSILAVQWLKRRSAPSAWLSLDRFDNDLERFASYVVAALREVVPEGLESVDALLRAPTLPPPEVLAEAMIGELQPPLESQGGDPQPGQTATLVLDDYHSIVSEDVQRLVRRLVEELPETLRLVVLTRADPPWPLGLWRSRFWLAELRALDLRFSLEETRAFFTSDQQVRLADDTIEGLHRKTEGWIAGLRLAQISFADSPRPEERAREFSASDRLVVDYLIEEVLAVQPPEIRELLAVTAPLDRFCAPMCDHVLADRSPRPHSGETIARLERGNLFLFPLDAREGWYRYHHLFQQLLLDHLEDLKSPERRAEILRRAGEWLAREGRIEEALQHLVAAGELDPAAELVWDHLHAVMDRDLSNRTLARWLAIFPPEAELGRLPLLVAHLYLRVRRWDVQGMARLAGDAEEALAAAALPEARRREVRTDLDTLLAFVLYWQGDAAAALEHASRALRTAARGGWQHSLAVIYKAGALARTGNLEEALRFLNDELMEDGAAGSHHAGAFLFAQAVLRLYAGQLDGCRDGALRVLALDDTVSVPVYWLGYAHYLLGVVAYERNLLGEAEEHFRRTAALRYHVTSRLSHDALLGLALVARAKGEDAEADGHAAAARALALEVSDPLSLRISDAFEIRLALAAGRPSELGPAPPAAAEFASFWLEVPSLIHAENLIHTGSPEGRKAALAEVERALDLAEEHDSVRQAIQFSTLRALALAGIGERDTALACLAETLHRAEPHGFVRTFVDRGPRLRELLEDLVVRHPGDRYAAKLLGALAPAPGPGRPDEAAGSPPPGRAAGDTSAEAAPFEVLSNREVDVLELLESRLSNKEVAARLGISPETVKRHTLSIYSKLGVHGRRQAVAAAIARGILRPS